MSISSGFPFTLSAKLGSWGFPIVAFFTRRAHVSLVPDYRQYLFSSCIGEKVQHGLVEVREEREQLTIQPFFPVCLPPCITNPPPLPINISTVQLGTDRRMADPITNILSDWGEIASSPKGY